MKKGTLIAALALVLSFSVQTSYAQISQDQIDQGKELLSEKDISEDEIRKRLQQRGIDPDNIPPEKLPEMESILQEIIAEIEAEQADEGSSISTSGFRESTVEEDSVDNEANLLLKSNEDVQEKKADGASLEEAISEDYTDTLNVQQGKEYAVFGQHIFRNKSLSVYRTTESAFTPDNYVLDVGDKLSITIFGVSQADVSYEIEKDGFIRPSNMPKIYLRGLPYGKAKTLIRNRFRQAYSFSDGQINIAVRSARTITVNIFGEVEVPGSYTISALNTAINALMAAGGVKNSGSVRQIQIVRNGKRRYIDLYDFINSPSQRVDLHLENNDILFVPLLGKTVEILGGVRRPEKYEMKAKEDFMDLLEFAQGFTPAADQSLMNTSSYLGNKVEHKDVDLAPILAGSKKLQLNDGDSYYIRYYRRGYRDVVFVGGPVNYPGMYAIKEGMTAADLIELSEPHEMAKPNLAFVIRQNDDNTNSLLPFDWNKALDDPNSKDNIKLMPRDKVQLYARADYADRYNVEIRGAVRRPTEHFWSVNNQMTVYDLINLAGGLTEGATEFGYVIHTSPKNPKIRSYDLLNLAEIIKNPSSASNLALQKGDIVFAFKSSDYSEDYTISIRGAVRKPITVPYSTNLDLRDLITLAGGLKDQAASNKIDVFRLETNNNKPTRTVVQTMSIDANFDPLEQQQLLVLKPYDVVVVRLTPEYEDMKFVNIEGEVKYPGEYALLNENETLAEIVERAGGLTREAFVEGSKLVRSTEINGNVVLDMKTAITRPNSRANMTMKAGDLLIIPKTMDYVTITSKGTNASRTYTSDLIDDGNVHITFMGKRSARWYVNNYAGGFSKRARKSRTNVIHPNGQIIKTRNLLLFKVYPKVPKGSVIAITERPEKDKERVKREPVTQQEIFTTLTNTLTLVTTALTTALLARTL